MAISPYVPFSTFKSNNPILNHSSRVFLVEGSGLTIYDLRVSDAQPLESDTPIVSLSLTTLSFPDTELNVESDTLTVTITNTGTAPLAISAITASGDFQVESLT